MRHHLETMTDLLSKDHTILERRYMEYRPFGTWPDGEPIRDVSGTTVRANMECLEEGVSRLRGPEAGARAVEELCRLLNERIRDPAYHVTPAFLKNVWNSYSYEFVMFLAELCEQLTGDPQFQHKVGQRFITPLIQTLGRPFSVSQIYRMFPHFGDKFVKGSVIYGPATVTERSAILSMKFTDRVYQEFGPYRKACAELICQCVKSSLSSIPERVHHLKPATVTERACIVNGAEYCEWEYTWEPGAQARLLEPAVGAMAGGLAFAALRLRYPGWTVVEAAFTSLFPALTAWLAADLLAIRKEFRSRSQLVQEQLRFVESRHDELREAYLEQEQRTIELRQRIRRLTILHRTGLLFHATRDPDELIESVLQALIRDLPYDRAMFSFYDEARQVSHDARVRGASAEVAALARARVMPIMDPDSFEGTVFLRGQPLLIPDLNAAWDRLHPMNQQLAAASGANAVVSVPLKVQERVLGALTVDRTKEHSLTKDDLEVMTTLSHQVALALANALAYRQLEELNVGLEDKVRERTAVLEQTNRNLAAANARLHELGHLKSSFVSITSHELRTPMVSIKGYVDNLLDGLAGSLTQKQAHYLARIGNNAERLARMTNDLLDLSTIEAGRIVLHCEPLALGEAVDDVVDSLQTLARRKSITVRNDVAPSLPLVTADRDKLHQVLTNLIQNAIKFTPSGGDIHIEGRAQDGRCVRVCVADTGCGIPSHDLEKVFEKFYRSESAPAEAKGAGLGLAIVKTLVELQGGRLWVISEVGRGSQFFFTVPIHRPSAMGLNAGHGPG